jgi:hypothetical protein
MFSTFESAAVHIPPIFDYDDERWWAYVHLQHFSPYFHMVIQYKGDDDYLVSKTLLYHHASQVVGTAEEPDVIVEEIQIVLPKHKSKSGCWEMHQLSELLVGFEPNLEHEQTAYVYVLADGTRVVESALSTSEDELEQLATWYKFDR